MTPDIPHEQYWIPISAEEFGIKLKKWLRDESGEIGTHGITVRASDKKILLSYETAIYDYFRIACDESGFKYAYKNPGFWL